NVDVDLSPLAGKDVKFILTVLTAGSAQQDRALWVGPHIYRAGASPATSIPANTATVTATATATTTVTATGTTAATSTATATATSTSTATATSTPPPQ
ncbi:MAG TPA: hypothetical protein VFY25_15385, partial [Anaerolineales bacterium]|nr:hypothetical protein [Anaerolineales bacterium]